MFKSPASYLVFISCLISISCSKKISYAEAEFIREPEMRRIPYSLSTPLKNPGKLVVIIPDDPDTNHNYYLALAEKFHSKAYNIMLIGKPGEDSYKKRSLDSREARIEDIVRLLNTSDSLFKENLVLVGSGQGAYLLPEVFSRINPSLVIMLNAGVLSPLAELEYIMDGDSLSAANRDLLAWYGIDNMDMLREKITNIKEQEFGTIQLAPSSNRNWMSYYRKPLLNQIEQVNCGIMWINYEDYPLLSVTGLDLTESIVVRNANIKYLVLKNTNAKAEIETYLNHYLNKR